MAARAELSGGSAPESADGEPVTAESAAESVAVKSAAAEPVGADSVATRSTAPQPRAPDPTESTRGQSTAALAEPHLEPAKGEADREPPGAEPDEAEPEAAELHQAEPEAAELHRAEQDGTEPYQAEQDTAELYQAEQDGAEPYQAEQDTAELYQAEQDGPEQDRAEPYHAEEDGAEQDGAEEDEQAGRGRGVSRLVGAAIAVVVIGLAAAVGALAVTTHGFRPKTVVTYRQAAVFRLRAGDCVNSSQNGLSVTVLSCASPHDAEVFATFSLTGSSWPGNAAIEQRASSGCGDRIAGYVNPALANAGLAQEFVYPNRQAWQGGERTVVCEVSSTSGQLTGSVRQGG